MFWFGFADPAGANPTPGAGPGQQPPHPQEEYEDTTEAVNQVIVAMMPWALSLLLHAGMVLLAIFAVWTTVTEVPEEEVIVPVATLSKTPGAPITQQQTRQTAQRTSASTARRSVSKSTSTVSGGIGAGSGASSGAAAGAGSGMAALIGAGGGGGGGSGSPFGASTGSAGSFKATFYGTGGNARKIGYLIDASGSLIDTLPFVLQELKRSIGELSDQQSFAVVFFQGEEVVEVPPKGMTRATAENKQKVVQWIDESAGNVVAQGLTSPLKALQLALRYKPHLLFILSDNITGQGRFEVDQKRLLREIESINSAATKINTIQFIYPDPLVKVGMKATMEMIAENSGGQYKFLDGRELGIQ